MWPASLNPHIHPLSTQCKQAPPPTTPGPSGPQPQQHRLWQIERYGRRPIGWGGRGEGGSLADTQHPNMSLPNASGSWFNWPTHFFWRLRYPWGQDSPTTPPHPATSLRPLSIYILQNVQCWTCPCGHFNAFQHISVLRCNPMATRLRLTLKLRWMLDWRQCLCRRWLFTASLWMKVSAKWWMKIKWKNKLQKPCLYV